MDGLTHYARHCLRCVISGSHHNPISVLPMLSVSPSEEMWTQRKDMTCLVVQVVRRGTRIKVRL